MIYIGILKKVDIVNIAFWHKLMDAGVTVRYQTTVLNKFVPRSFFSVSISETSP